MTARELATVLAALRYYQNSPSIGEPSYVNDIATGNGAFEHMTADEIDDLCEKLNLGEADSETDDHATHAK